MNKIQQIRQILEDITFGELGINTSIRQAQKALTLLNDLEKEQAWQGMDSAPRDGTHIIVYRPSGSGKYIPKVGSDYMGDTHGLNRTWMKSNSANPPTHWRPLPAPPEGE